MNSKIFEGELTYIEDDAVRKFTETALDNLPLQVNITLHMRWVMAAL